MLLKLLPLLRPNQIRKEPLIMIEFDDGTGTDLTIAYPYLKSKGLVATFMVIAGKVGDPATGGGRYEGQWADYKNAIADGFDVQCHTYDHVRVTQMTKQQLIDNMLAVNAAFIANGLSAPDFHASPNWDTDDYSISILRQYRKAVIRDKGYNYWETVAFDRFKALPSDCYSDERQIELYAQIDKIKNESLIGVVVNHRITDTPTDEYLSRTDLWYDWIDYIAASGIRTVTYSDLYQIIREYKG